MNEWGETEGMGLCETLWWGYIFVVICVIMINMAGTVWVAN